MPGTDGIGADPKAYVDQGLETVPVTLHFTEGVDKLELSGDQLRKMAGAQVLNLTKATIESTSNHSDGAQTLVIKNSVVNPTAIETNRRHFMVTGTGVGATAVVGAHYVAGPGNHNKLANPFEIHLRQGGPLSDSEHHQNVMKQLKWSANEGDDKATIIAKSNIIEAEKDGIRRYAVSTDPADGPFPALLASKPEHKLKEMLPNSSVAPTDINGKQYRIIEERDFHAGVDAFASITSKQELGTKGLTFARAGSTEGDLIVQATLHREPHPDCEAHEHLPGVRKGLKYEHIADTVGVVADDAAPKVQETAAAAAIFGSSVNVKDGASKKKAATATIVTGFEDGGDEEAALTGDV